MKKEHKEKQSKETGSNQEAKIAELTDMVQRIQAQYENAQKRQEKESDIKVGKAITNILRSILPIMDAFDAAEKHTKDGKEQTAIKILADQAAQVLLGLGITPMETLGKRFDAHLHEAMMVTEQKGKDNIILEEFQKGYLYHATVLRHAKVKVGKDTSVGASTGQETVNKSENTDTNQKI